MPTIRMMLAGRGNLIFLTLLVFILAGRPTAATSTLFGSMTLRLRQVAWDAVTLQCPEAPQLDQRQLRIAPRILSPLQSQALPSRQQLQRQQALRVLLRRKLFSNGKRDSMLIPSDRKYGQCGGQGWSGPTVCTAGSTCMYQNAYYSQCL